jgi:hypothetical protein
MLTRSGMFWHDEQHVLSVSAAWLHRQPMYPASNSPERYGLLYGPVTFLVYALPLHFAPDAPLVLRCWLLLPFLAALLFLYRSVRYSLQTRLALGIGGVAVCLLNAGGHASILFGARADVWLLAASAVAVWAALQRSVVVCATACAAIANLKASDSMLALALLVFLCQRVNNTKRWMAVAIFVLTSVCAFALPGISLPNYLSILADSLHHRFLPALLLRSLLIFVICLLLPVACIFLAKVPSSALRTLFTRYRRTCAAWLLAAAAAIVSGSKHGSGEWQLWPLIPVIAAGSAKILQTGLAQPYKHFPEKANRLQWIGVASLAIILLIAGRYARRAVNYVLWLPPRSAALAIVQELHDVEHAFPETKVVVGPGRNGGELAYEYGYVAVAEGNPEMVNENAVNEDLESGLNSSAGTVALLTECGNRIWLFSAGDTPFAMHSSYDENRMLFPEILRAEFTQTHHIALRLRYYDVWTCNEKSSNG